jgi:hypothetical protein
MMRVFIPKNIKGGFFNMDVPLGPINVNLIQLLIIAAGAGLSITIWQSLVKSGMEKMVAFIFIVPIILITLLIAFFKLSELTLLPFIAKLLRTYFFDTPKKIYIPTKQVDPLEVLSYQVKTSTKQKVEEKTLEVDKDKLKKLYSFDD